MKAGMISVRLKSKKLTASTTSMGRPKNSSSTTTRGATCSHEARSPGYSTASGSVPADAKPPAAWSTMAMSVRRSGRDELVPAPRQVAVLVHHRVPAGDVAHAVPDGAAVARHALLLHQGAVGILDVDGRRLAFVPVVPFLRRQELLGSRGPRRIVALLGDESALPAGIVPVDVLPGAVGLQPAEMGHRRETDEPAAIAFLERRVITVDAARAHRGHGRRPHRLDHHLARGHQVHRLVEGA